jgi:hypothetical protein
MGGGRVEVQWEPKVAQVKCLWICNGSVCWWKWGVSVAVVVMADAGGQTRHIAVLHRMASRENVWDCEDSTETRDTAARLVKRRV